MRGRTYGDADDAVVVREHRSPGAHAAFAIERQRTAQGCSRPRSAHGGRGRHVEGDERFARWFVHVASRTTRSARPTRCQRAQAGTAPVHYADAVPRAHEPEPGGTQPGLTATPSVNHVHGFGPRA